MYKFTKSVTAIIFRGHFFGERSRNFETEVPYHLSLDLILFRWIMATKSFIETSLLKECFSITLLHMYTYHITCNICKLGCKKWIAMCRSNERKSIIGYTGQFEFGLLEDSGYVPLTEIITNKVHLDTNKNYFYLKKAFLDFTLEYAILHHIQNIFY